MYKKILVAYDGSEFSDVALSQGCELARLYKAELHLAGLVATRPYMAMAEGVGGIDTSGAWRGMPCRVPWPAPRKGFPDRA